MRPRLATWFGFVAVLASCGKDPGGAAAPKTDPVTESPAGLEATGESETGETGEEPGIPRLALETEFHRTRVTPGAGFWVLGIVHNPHGERVTDVRMKVRLLDEAAKAVARAEGRVRRSLGPGERAGVAVLVADPVAHEELELRATAVVDEGPAPEPLTLKLVHDPPARADFGGWYVLGRVENTGSEPVVGARLEIQGLDASGRLLGIDWLDLDPVDPGEAIEFDVGDLRYEEPPARFLLELRGPALE